MTRDYSVTWINLFVQTEIAGTMLDQFVEFLKRIFIQQKLNPFAKLTAMAPRSTIRVETRFSRSSPGESDIYRNALFRNRSQTIKRTLFTLERRPDAFCSVFHSLNRREFTLNA